MADFIKIINSNIQLPTSILISIVILIISLPILLNYLINKKMNNNKQYSEISFNTLQEYFDMLLTLIDGKLTKEDKEEIAKKNAERLKNDDELKKRVCKKTFKDLIFKKEKDIIRELKQKKEFNISEGDVHEILDIALNNTTEKEKVDILKSNLSKEHLALCVNDLNKAFQKIIDDIIYKLVRLGKKNTVYYLSLIALICKDIDSNLFEILNLKFLDELLEKKEKKKLFYLLKAIISAKTLVSLKKDTLGISMSFLDLLHLKNILNKDNELMVKYLNRCILINKFFRYISFIFPKLDKLLNKYNNYLFNKLFGSLYGNITDNRENKNA